ncbi:MarR family winged helix-turn-helix transcriptional regulator [Thalassospira australica]|uniref:MarR family winged helix-turn-helix transcriptional regulator n=1 Tax=Thalassospira australica TaxID=1528106 RepID=UPI0038500853
MDDHDNDPLRLENFLCFSVYAASHAFNRIYKPLLDALELTYPQYLVMVTLWEQDDQPVRSIGEKLFLESSTLTPLLKRLEAAGLVKRTRDPKDERSVRITLTVAGRELRQKALDVPRCVGEVAELDLSTIKRLIDDLGQLRDNLEANALRK